MYKVEIMYKVHNYVYILIMYKVHMCTSLIMYEVHCQIFDLADVRIIWPENMIRQGVHNFRYFSSDFVKMTLANYRVNISTIV